MSYSDSNKTAVTMVDDDEITGLLNSKRDNAVMLYSEAFCVLNSV